MNESQVYMIIKDHESGFNRVPFERKQRRAIINRSEDQGRSESSTKKNRSWRNVMTNRVVNGQVAFCATKKVHELISDGISIETIDMLSKRGVILP